MPKTNFNKVLTLWTCQTYMENMSTTLKPDEISFGVLFFWHKLRQFRTFLKLLPIGHPTNPCIALDIPEIFPYQHTATIAVNIIGFNVLITKKCSNPRIGIDLKKEVLDCQRLEVILTSASPPPKIRCLLVAIPQ